ncbi:TM2 domain-containing protein [Xylanibacillus composti]|uniref:TM2 domain-containing protein n=1 Tax=Xylanibacillus composti TaxID=1572762 RepID=UPI001FD614D2|nr:TM2 domain-containing protein [Xylanibacillus composti]
MQFVVQAPAQPVYRSKKNKIVAGLLAIFLGVIGIHKFYLGRHGQGILYLIFCWTYIPAFIGFIEGIVYLCSDEERFHEKYSR